MLNDDTTTNNLAATEMDQAVVNTNITMDRNRRMVRMNIVNTIMRGFVISGRTEFTEADIAVMDAMYKMATSEEIAVRKG